MTKKKEFIEDQKKQCKKKKKLGMTPPDWFCDIAAKNAWEKFQKNAPKPRKSILKRAIENIKGKKKLYDDNLKLKW